MPALILYLLKVNVALLLFYLAYRVVLRKLTFYHLNRLFLVFGVLFAALYPFIDLSELLSQNEELAVMQTYAAIPAWVPTATTAPAQTAAFDYWLIPVTLFWFGTALMAGRLLLQFHTLYKIHRASEPASYQGIDFRKISGIREAFSFWKTIYLNPEQHKKEELKSILRHERIHVEGWHTLDVLLAELSTVFYWFNPGVWFMKRAIKENLEFIADHDVVRAGADKKEYQYLLLKATGATEPQLALSFSFPSLKRRIAMMNKMPTKKANRLRLLVVLPIVAVLLLAFRGASEQPTQQEILIGETPAASLPVQQLEETLYVPASDEAFQDDDPVYIPDAANQLQDYKDFMNRNPQVKQVGWKGSKKNVLVIFLNAGATEMYNLQDDKSRAAAESNYGKLPVLPPPPPPAVPDAPAQKLPDAQLYKAFMDRNHHLIRNTAWHQGKLIITLHSGVQETYNQEDPISNAELERKYGKVPGPPPPAAPPAPEAAKLIDSESTVAYIFDPNSFTEDEFTTAQELFSKYGYRLTFEKQYKGGELSQLKLLANDQRGSLTGTYGIEELKSSNEVVILKIDKVENSIGITTQPRNQ